MKSFEKLCDEHYESMFDDYNEDCIDRDTQREIDDTREEEAIERMREKVREEKELTGKENINDFVFTDEMEEQLKEFLKRSNN